MNVDLNLATPAWYEANKAKSWRERMAGDSEWRQSRTNTDPKLFYLEEAIEAAFGDAIIFEKIEIDGLARIILHFSDDSVRAKEARFLFDLELTLGIKTYVFDRFEATTIDEGGFGYDGEYVSSSYPRATVVYSSDI